MGLVADIFTVIGAIVTIIGTAWKIGKPCREKRAWALNNVVYAVLTLAYTRNLMAS
jgi:hypothetical protein